MTTPLAIAFESPRAGWLPHSISAGGSRVSLDISYTPNDFLEELLNAALSVVQWEGTSVVHVYEEPEEKVLRISRVGESVTLTVERRRSAEELFRFVGTVAETVLPIWRALRRVESDPDFLEWHRPFPTAGMEQLTAVARSLKAPAA